MKDGSNGHKHIYARVTPEFHTAVKVQLAQKGLSMHVAVIKSLAETLEIDLEEHKGLFSEKVS